MVAPSSASFFVSGGTVPLGAASYVAREADRALLDALRAGRYAYVLTSRQMGKSSLSVRTMEALRSEGVRTAFVDLTRVGGRNVTAEQWYTGLLGEIGRGLGDRAGMLASWKAHPEVGPMQRFFGVLGEAVAASPDPVVVFVDEIDATKSLPFSTDEFFAGIRECSNRRVQEPAMARLTFCLIGVAIPSDLMSDTKLTPFNVGERIVLRDFSVAEASALAAGLGASGAALVERVAYWTGGHPFLTQSLCRRLAEERATGVAEVDRLVAGEFFEARARETNINLADVGNRVLNSYDDPDGVAKYRADVLSLYERIVKGRRVEDDESNRLIAVLKLAGLVKAEGGVLRVRNRIYERVFGLDWIRENMPSQERRRQQRAFRRGAIRTAAVAAAVLTVVSSLALTAMRSAAEARAALAKAKTEETRAKTSEARALTAEGQAKELAAARTVALGEATVAKTKAVRLAEERKQALDRAKVAEARALDQSRLARASAGRERVARLEAQDAAGQARSAAAEARRAQGRANEAARLVLQGQASLRAELYENAIESARLIYEQGDRAEAAATLAAVADRKEKGWEWRYWRRLSEAEYVLTSKQTPGPRIPDRTAVFPLPAPSKEVIVYDSTSARRVDATTGRTIRELWRLPPPDPSIRGIGGVRAFPRFPHFSRNGRWAVHDDAQRRPVIHDLTLGTVRPLGLTANDFVDSVSDDGLRVATFQIPNFGSGSGSTGQSDPTQISVWDGRTGQSIPVRQPKAPFFPNDLLATDGRTLYLGYRDVANNRLGVAEYDYTSGVTKAVYTLTAPAPGGAAGVPFSPHLILNDGSIVVAVGSRIGVFDQGRPEPRLVFEVGTAYPQISASPDGRFLVVSKSHDFSNSPSWNPSNAVWDLHTGTLVARLPRPGRLIGDGRIIVTDSFTSREVAGIDWRKAQRYEDAQILRPKLRTRGIGLAQLLGDFDRISVFPDGTILSNTVRWKAENNVTSLQEVSNTVYDTEGRIRGRFPETGDLDSNTLVNVGASWLTSWSAKEGYRIRRLSDLKVVQTLMGSNNWPTVSRDGRRSATIGPSGLLQVWEGGPRQLKAMPSGMPTLKVGDRTFYASCLLSPDGTKILGYDGRHGYRIWDFRTLRLLATSSDNDFSSAEFSPTGNAVILHRQRGALDWHDLKSGARRSLLPALSSDGVAFSPDDRLLAVALGDEIEIRSTRTGRRLFSLESRSTANQNGLFVSGKLSLAFSEDGRRLSVLYGDGVLRTFRGGE